jgi:hypothetical protein
MEDKHADKKKRRTGAKHNERERERGREGEGERDREREITYCTEILNKKRRH